jgi:hypothetical protein
VPVLEQTEAESQTVVEDSLFSCQVLVRCLRTIADGPALTAAQLYSLLPERCPRDTLHCTEVCLAPCSRDESLYKVPFECGTSEADPEADSNEVTTGHDRVLINDAATNPGQFVNACSTWSGSSWHRHVPEWLTSPGLCWALAAAPTAHRPTKQITTGTERFGAR